MDQSVEKTFFEPLTDSSLTGLDDFDPRIFKPTPGTILVVMPPPVRKTKGGVDIPDTVAAKLRACVAKVSAVPPDSECPVEPGDYVLFRKESELPLDLGGRTDLAVLQYSGDATSEILGFFAKSDVNLLDKASSGRQNGKRRPLPKGVV